MLAIFYREYISVVELVVQIKCLPKYLKQEMVRALRFANLPLVEQFLSDFIYFTAS